jgi:hypothetical protein
MQSRYDDAISRFVQELRNAGIRFGSQRELTVEELRQYYALTRPTSHSDPTPVGAELRHVSVG